MQDSRSGATRLRVISLVVAVGIMFMLWPGAAHAAPPSSVVEVAKADLAERTGTDPADITLLRAEAVTWSDGCLGVAEPGEFCIQVLIDGWVLWLGVDSAGYRYHTDTEQQIRFAAGPFSLDEIAEAPLPGGTAEQPEEPRFIGELPDDGGVAAVIWTGGSAEQLSEAAPNALSFWVTEEGGFVGYIPGAPAFVNQAFLDRFPGGTIPAGTLMIVALSS